MNASLALSKSAEVPNQKETSHYHMPSQYARVKNVANGEEAIIDNMDQTNGFVQGFLDESMKISSVYMKQMKMENMNIGHQTIMLMQQLSKVILYIIIV
jgi:hypothetical protein